LKVTGEQPAGIDHNLSIRPGEALRIFTGAPIPRGADAVIMQEDVTLSDGRHPDWRCGRIRRIHSAARR
jgi:molybdopterin molybdotransferase